MQLQFFQPFFAHTDWQDITLQATQRTLVGVSAEWYLDLQQQGIGWLAYVIQSNFYQIKDLCLRREWQREMNELYQEQMSEEQRSTFA